MSPLDRYLLAGKLGAVTCGHARGYRKCHLRLVPRSPQHRAAGQLRPILVLSIPADILAKVRPADESQAAPALYAIR